MELVLFILCILTTLFIFYLINVNFLSSIFIYNLRTNITSDLIIDGNIEVH